VVRPNVWALIRIGGQSESSLFNKFGPSHTCPYSTDGFWPRLDTHLAKIAPPSDTQLRLS